MTRNSDIRVEYRRDTGDLPFEIGNWVTDELYHPYAKWLEDKLVETRNELEEKKSKETELPKVDPTKVRKLNEGLK